MALQSSGQITLQDIGTELGVGVANLSLASMSDTAGFSEPDAMTDFYGYSASVANDYYWRFTGSQGLGFTRGGTAQQSNNDLSVSMWIRPEWAATDVNAMLCMISPDAIVTTNRFFIMYDYGLNRFILRQRTNGVNSRGTHFSLNDSGNYNVSGTGGGKWTGANRGDVNSDGFAHITVTFDYSATSGAAAFKMYWNGSELPNTVSNLTGTLTTFSYQHVYINKSNNVTTNSRDAKYDNYAIFNNKLLSDTEVDNLYNGGTSIIPSEAGEDDNVMFLFDSETSSATAVDGDDYATTWVNNFSTGSRTAY
jgi:hypothetical protein